MRFAVRFSLKRWLLCLVLIPIVLLTAWTTHIVKIEHQKNIKTVLETVLKTTHAGLRIWATQKIEEVVFWANFKEVQELVHKILLTRSRTSRKKLDRLLIPVTALDHYTGYFILAPNGVLIAGGPEHMLGSEGLQLLGPIATHFTVLLSKEGYFSLPFRSAITDKVVMILTSPIKWHGEVVALLGFSVDPERDFSQTIQLGSLGTTGETYAFDKNGRLVSESRFDEHLEHIGLIPPGQHGVLYIEIRDPGGNLVTGYKPKIPRNQQPLTKMARSATQGQNGIDLDGYRDYRGVPTVGAWLWDSELGIGLATELDQAEAHKVYVSTNHLILALLSVTVLGGIIVTIALWKQNTKLEEAVQSRDQFLAVASHELRTPVTSLRSYIEFINRLIQQGKLETYPKDRLLHLTDISIREFARLSLLISTLLDVTRMTRGHLSLNTERVDLSVLVKSAIDILCENFKSAGCPVKVNADTPVYANVDSLRTEQVIVNLLSNALKFGKKKPIEVSVAKEGSTAKILVEDHGLGISSEDQKKLFQKFERIGASSEEGLGLGLYISKQIVDLHGGTITVKSVLGEGSLFIVEIPIDDHH